MLMIKGGFTNREVASLRHKFYRRFRHLPTYLPKQARILCAGARQGTEVEVLYDLGFIKATGVDLNPGPDNRWVHCGDFMHLGYASSSMDMVYSNSLDHAFDLNAFFAEHSRVTKPDGYALYDIAIQEGGAFEATEWASPDAVLPLMLRHFDSIIRMETDGRWKWVLLQGEKREPARSVAA